MGDLVGEDLLTELYLLILHRGGSSVQEFLHQGYQASQVDAAFVVLEARGMIARADDERWRVVPPEQALPAFAGRLESRARSVRASLPGLVAAYRDAAQRNGTGSGAAGIEHLTGSSEVAFAIAQCFADARFSAKGMRTDSMTTRHLAVEIVPGARSGELNVVGRKISVQSVIDNQLLTTLDTSELGAFQQTPNFEIFVAPGVPFTAAVNDNGTAVVETSLGGRIDGLLIRDPAVVAVIENTVDLMVRLASPWRAERPGHAVARSRRTTTPTDGLTDEEREILTLMTTGLPDTTIARRLGISPRTLDRRVRTLLDRFNAVTRFQAGVQAARRGLV